MISGKSFWVKLINNNKQKLWMWIVSFISFFICYPSILLIYFRRIEGNYSYGMDARTLTDYGNEMVDAVSDALAFNGAPVAFVMAILFGTTVFAYLNSKSKMDMLRSVPVKTKDIFVVDYVSGILLYVIPMVVNVLIAVIIAFSWGYLGSLGVQEILFGQLMNLLIYLMYYSLAVICVCITGNIILGLCGTVIVSGVPGLVESVLNDIQFTFFNTADALFLDKKSYFSPIARYYTSDWQLKEANNITKEIGLFSTELIVWPIVAIALGLLAYLAYIKRPTEAMNKSVYSSKLQKIIKVIFGSGASIICGYIAYSSSGNDPVLFAIAGVIAALIIGMTFEVIYAGDIRSAFKSIGTTVSIGVICLIVFVIYNFDIFGYDRFVPSENQIESYAIDVNAMGYNDAFDFMDENNIDGSARVEWGSNINFYKENMFITNIEAIRKLTEKSIDEHIYDRSTDDKVRCFSVMYRRKNGGTVARCLYVDMADEESLRLFNEIIAEKEWREGFFQVISKKEVLNNYDLTVKYVDMVNNFKVDCSLDDIIEAWEKDMEKFDYFYGSQKFPCAKISINFPGQFGYTLPIYNDFDNVYRLIKAEHKYSDRKITAQDIEGINVTNFHSEYWEDANHVDYTMNPEVKIKVTDKEQIEELIDIIKPAYLNKFWSDNDMELSNYEAQIDFVPERTPNNTENDIYNFTEYVPQWLVDATAY